MFTTHHQFQHLLGISVHLNDALLKSGHLGHVVVTALTLLLLQLDGDASHWPTLDPIHQMSDKSGEETNIHKTKSTTKLYDHNTYIIKTMTLQNHR